MKLAYLTDEEMIFWDNGERIPVPSQYLKSYKENMRVIQDRKAWKQKSMTAAMGPEGMILEQMMNRDEKNHKITGITPFGTSKSFIYSIRIDQMGGVFKVNPYDKNELEGHIYHDKDIYINDPVYNRRNSTMVYSMNEPSGKEHIATLNLKTGDTRTLTDGDSVDAYPSWKEGSKEEIIFQTAGIGRNQAGLKVTMGPTGISSMNIGSGEITELVYDYKFDYLAPMMDKNGNIYAIKRPYRTESHGSGNIITDILMFPFRIVNAIFGFLNIFSMRYSGKPLSTGTNPARQDGDPQKLLIHGNLIDAQQIIEEAHRRGNKHLGIVPRSWKLVKLSQDGDQEILSEGVISFDRASDGSIVCCNGKEIYSLDENGTRSSIVKEKFIEKVVAF